MKNIIIILFVLLLFGACKKAELMRFEALDGIAFYLNSGSELDSANYSFSGLSTTVKPKDTIWLKMRTTGRASNQDREISVVPTSVTTGVQGVNFILPKIVLPAHKFEIRYPIVLLNTPDLLTKTYKLVVAIAQSKDLVIGAPGQADFSTRNIVRYTINFNNQVIKPSYWNYLQGYFGTYSDVKYKFMISSLGITDFKPTTLGGPITYEQYLIYAGRVKNALDAYEAINGPLLDENKLRVVFP